MENLVHFHPDCFKLMSNAISQPADLGAEAMHAYYFPSRMNSGPSHPYLFEDVFEKRQWSCPKIPAIAGYIENYKSLVIPEMYQVSNKCSLIYRC